MTFPQVDRSYEVDSLYEFVYRAVLAEEALDAMGRVHSENLDEAQIIEALSFELFDDDILDQVHQMSMVYTAIAAFEVSVRRFIKKVLMDEFGESWWSAGVSEKIRKFAESRQNEEARVRWHSVRGDDLLDYTELGQLSDIIQKNWAQFEVYIPRMDWATAIFSTLERSRNVIMHSGVLSLQDIERIGMNIRDWNKQVSL